MKDTAFNVVASGDRLKEDGTVAPIKAPIDLETGRFNTDKGSPELAGVWYRSGFRP